MALQRRENPRTFQVFGTGDELPRDALWVATCPRHRGLVFHLYELNAR